MGIDKFILSALPNATLKRFLVSDKSVEYKNQPVHAWSDGHRNGVITTLHTATKVPCLQALPNSVLAGLLHGDTCRVFASPDEWSDSIRNGFITLLHYATRLDTGIFQAQPNKVLCEFLKDERCEKFATSKPEHWSDGLRNVLITMLHHATHVATPILQAQPNSVLRSFLKGDRCSISRKDPSHWTDDLRNVVITVLHNAKKTNTGELQGQSNDTLAHSLRH